MLTESMKSTVNSRFLPLFERASAGDYYSIEQLGCEPYSTKNELYLFFCSILRTPIHTAYYILSNSSVEIKRRAHQLKMYNTRTGHWAEGILRPLLGEAPPILKKQFFLLV